MLKTPMEQLLVVVGHPLEKSEVVVVCIDRNYHSPKVHTKMSHSEDQPKRFLLDCRIALLVNIELLLKKQIGCLSPSTT